MNNEEVIEYLYDPTETIDDDDVNALVKVYIEPRHKRQVEASEIAEEEEKGSCELQCQYCERSFKRQNGLVLHMRTHLNRLSCNECSQQFSSHRSLSIHLQSHSVAGEFTCEECGKSFKRANLLAAHRRTHGDELKPYICSLCSSGFALASLLDDHIRSEHVEGDVFRCLVCNEEYTESTGLTDHICRKRQRIRRRSKSAPKQHTCKHCGRVFGSLSNLSSHMRTHTGERPFCCDQCGRRFTRSDILTAHVSTHTGVKPHACPFCAKTFQRPWHRMVHMRTHTGERPHKCDVCSKEFMMPSSLVEHMRSHTGIKPHKCDICGHQFNRPCHLMVHMRAHVKSVDLWAPRHWHSAAASLAYWHFCLLLSVTGRTASIVFTWGGVSLSCFWKNEQVLVPLCGRGVVVARQMVPRWHIMCCGFSDFQHIFVFSKQHIEVYFILVVIGICLSPAGTVSPLKCYFWFIFS